MYVTYTVYGNKAHTPFRRNGNMSYIQQNKKHQKTINGGGMSVVIRVCLHSSTLLYTCMYTVYVFLCNKPGMYRYLRAV